MSNRLCEELDITPEERALVYVERRRKKMRNYLIAAAVIVVLFAVLMISVYVRGTKKANENYEARIAEMLSEVAEKEDQISDLQEQLDNRTVEYVEVTREVDISIINAELHQIGELATMEYLYTDANRFSDLKKLFGVNVPFTTKTCIAKWDGVIKAGIDVNRITAELDNENYVITVWLPAAEILSHEIDDESFEVLDEKNGLFNPIKAEDVKTLEAVSKDAMEQRAIENGLLEKAFENAKAVVLKIMNANPDITERYSVEFKMLG